MGDPNAIERCLAASAGAAVAECATLPIDIAKVRLQTQAPLPDCTFRYTGFFQAMFVVGKEEGALALWRGISPALVRQVSYTSLSFVLYTPVRVLHPPTPSASGQEACTSLRCGMRWLETLPKKEYLSGSGCSRVAPRVV